MKMTLKIKALTKTSNFEPCVKKHSAGFRKKHIQNAKALEKSKRNNVILSRMRCWLKDGEIISEDTMKQYFSCIKRLVKLMNYDYTKHILFATIIYAERYVQNTNLITTSHLFRLLLTSTIVTLKFWEDAGVDLELCSYVFGINKKEINDMERHFLIKVDYGLILQNEEIDSFEYRPTLSSTPSVRVSDQMDYSYSATLVQSIC